MLTFHCIHYMYYGVYISQLVCVGRICSDYSSKAIHKFARRCGQIQLWSTKTYICVLCTNNLHTICIAVIVTMLLWQSLLWQPIMLPWQPSNKYKLQGNIVPITIELGLVYSIPQWLPWQQLITACNMYLLRFIT